ncbi:MAG: hypothetical protein ACRC6E_02445, partial [Fusobacteriaceae bacterium]
KINIVEPLRKALLLTSATAKDVANSYKTLSNSIAEKFDFSKEESNEIVSEVVTDLGRRGFVLTDEEGKELIKNLNVKAIKNWTEETTENKKEIIKEELLTLLNTEALDRVRNNEEAYENISEKEGEELINKTGTVVPQHVKIMMDELKNFDPNIGDDRIQVYHDSVKKGVFKNDDNYCTSFVNYALDKAGVKLNKKTASATDFIRNNGEQIFHREKSSKKAGDYRFVETGDVIGIRNENSWTGHIVSVVYNDEKNGIIYTLGGNQISRRSDLTEEENMNGGRIGYRMYYYNVLDQLEEVTVKRFGV